MFSIEWRISKCKADSEQSGRDDDTSGLLHKRRPKDRTGVLAINEMKRLLLLMLPLASLAAFRAELFAASNDRFSNRTTFFGTNVTVTGSNTSASKESGEPNHAGNPGGKSLWWSWTPPTNGDVTISTDGSNFDTLLGVYTGSTISSLSLVMSNDDHSVVVTSRVRFQVIRGVPYQIAVDGYNDGTNVDSGSVTLTLDFVSEPFNRPTNDSFTNRLTLQGLAISTKGTNLQATREQGEPLHAQKFGDASVWYTWTATTSGVARLSTEGSSFDTLLGVYSGMALSNLTEVASSDDIDSTAGILTSAVAFDVQAGQVFQITVDGFDGAMGQIVFRLETILTRLSAPHRLADGQFQFTLMGAPGRTYDIEASDSFVLWEPVVRIFNTNGVVSITDPVARTLQLRFYRAVLLP